MIEKEGTAIFSRDLVMYHNFTMTVEYPFKNGNEMLACWAIRKVMEDFKKTTGETLDLSLVKRASIMGVLDG